MVAAAELAWMLRVMDTETFRHLINFCTVACKMQAGKYRPCE